VLSESNSLRGFEGPSIAQKAQVHVKRQIGFSNLFSSELGTVPGADFSCRVCLMLYVDGRCLPRWSLAALLFSFGTCHYARCLLSLIPLKVLPYHAVRTDSKTSTLDAYLHRVKSAGGNLMVAYLLPHKKNSSKQPTRRRLLSVLPLQAGLATGALPGHFALLTTDFGAFGVR
jgi:hypothetical protein